ARRACTYCQHSYAPLRQEKSAQLCALRRLLFDCVIDSDERERDANCNELVTQLLCDVSSVDEIDRRQIERSFYVVDRWRERLDHFRARARIASRSHERRRLLV